MLSPIKVLSVMALYFAPYVAGFQRNVAYGSYEVYSTSDLGFPVDKVVFMCNGTLQVPVADGHELSREYGQIRHYDMDGNHLKTFEVPGMTTAICGFSENPVTGDLLLLDTGAAKLLKLLDNPCSARDGDVLDVEELSIGLGNGPNDMSYDEWGNIYITDTVLGHIYFVPAEGGDPDFLVEMVTPTPSGEVHPLAPMRPNYVTSNGIVYDHERSLFYVGHFGRGTLVRVHVKPHRNRNRLVVDESEFEFGVEEWRCCYNAPDGMSFDKENGYLYVTQINGWGALVFEVESGQIVFSYGDFNGVHTPRGGDMRQADDQLGGSACFLHDEEDGKYLYVANLNLRMAEFILPGLKLLPKTGLDNYMLRVEEHTIIKYKIDMDAYISPRSGRGG